MNTAVSRYLCAPSKNVPMKAYDLKKIIVDDGYHPAQPIFQTAVRVFASDRNFTKEELEFLVNVFEEGKFIEWQIRNFYFYADFYGTLRYARRSFWKLVALNEGKAAAKLAERTSSFIHNYAFHHEHGYGRHKADHIQEFARAQACHNAFAFFMLERYVRNDGGFDFWNGQTFKNFLAAVGRTTEEIGNAVYQKLLTSFQEKVSNDFYKHPHVTYAHWVHLRLLLVWLMEFPPCWCSKATKRELGILLNKLRGAEYEHPNSYSDDKLIKSIAMKEYLAGVGVVVQSSYKWLCGKDLKLELKAYRVDLID